MAYAEARKLCRDCERKTLHRKERFTFFHGAILTVLTGGIFAIFWPILALGAWVMPWRCQLCGIAYQLRPSDVFEAIARLVGTVAILIGLVGWLVGRSGREESESAERQRRYASRTAARQLAIEAAQEASGDAGDSGVSGRRFTATNHRGALTETLRSGLRTLAPSPTAFDVEGSRAVDQDAIVLAGPGWGALTYDKKREWIAMFGAGWVATANSGATIHVVDRTGSTLATWSEKEGHRTGGSGGW